MNRRDIGLKAYNAIYKALWYPRIYRAECVPILVYTMPKTGTTTLRNTLYRRGVGPVFWTHSMNRRKIAERRRRLAAHGLKPDGNRFWRDRVLERYLERGRALKIVTSIREAVARDVSAFFQRFAHVHRTNVNQYAGRFDELYEVFEGDVLRDGTRHSWFQREFEDVLGLRIFERPFPHEAGYQILHHGALDILLLKTETPDHVKEHALSEFLGVPQIKLFRANLGAEKGYAGTYRQFKERLRLPQDYIDSRYELPYMKHFYTDAEIAGFRRAWPVRT